MVRLKRREPMSEENINGEAFAFGSLDDVFAQMAQQQQLREQTSQKNDQNHGTRLIDKIGTDLTKLASQGKLDPVIGREFEIARTIEILNRRRKNNPVLIGEAGVGKTAVVEGLAQRIVENKVPEKLRNKRVIKIDPVSLVQGTSMRGQFEARMQQLLKEVQADSQVILFIDELHEIMGAGNATGGMDAGNILKPALARGDFQLVGATTLDEYREIEKDGALSRRFQQVMVDQPSATDTLAILNGLKSRYESYHKVVYTEGALKAMVNLSIRYLPERFLPDKAIDLMDESGSKKNLVLDFRTVDSIQQQVNNAEAMKQQAIEKEDYEKAGQWRDKVTGLKQELLDFKKNQAHKVSSEVTEQDIAKLIQEKTSIPVIFERDTEMTRLSKLNVNLKKSVIGHQEAIDQIVEALKRHAVGLASSQKPIASFLFVGPTGVGKTELAKQLAKEMFGTEESLIRFDMSEYMEPQSISKLIGAPAGYVGYEEAGQLTEQVRRHPYSLILLDEIEKASQNVLNTFLQVLDDGRLTDSQGHTVSFKDTIIIATSNAGSEDIGNHQVGFSITEPENKKTALMAELAPYFKPEFLNRFDGIIHFSALSQSNLLQIVDLMIKRLNETLAKKGIAVSLTSQVREKLAELGYDPKMGARPLKRVIQTKIEDPLTDEILLHPNEHAFAFKIHHAQIALSENSD